MLVCGYVTHHNGYQTKKINIQQDYSQLSPHPLLLFFVALCVSFVDAEVP